MKNPYDPSADLPNGWEMYTCSYKYKGKSWSFEIPAESFEDADGRYAAIHFNGQVDGVLKGVIPANPTTGLFVKTYVWFRNFLHKTSTNSP